MICSRHMPLASCTKRDLPHTQNSLTSPLCQPKCPITCEPHIYSLHILEGDIVILEGVIITSLEGTFMYIILVIDLVGYPLNCSMNIKCQEYQNRLGISNIDISIIQKCTRVRFHLSSNTFCYHPQSFLFQLLFIHLKVITFQHLWADNHVINAQIRCYKK